MRTVIVMEIHRSRVSELNRPECTVPNHEPTNFVPQPRGSILSPKKLMAKYLSLVSVRKVPTNEGDTTTSSDQGTSQDIDRPEEAAGTVVSGRDESRMKQASRQNGHVMTPVPNDIVHGIALEQTTQPTPFRAPQMSGRRNLKLVFSKLFGNVSYRKPVNDAQPAPATIALGTPAEAKPTSGKNNGTHEAMVSAPAQELATTISPVVTSQLPDLSHTAEPDATSNTTAGIDTAEYTLNVLSDSRMIYNPEDRIYVGRLYELPPPQDLNLHWHPIRTKLMIDLRRAIRTTSITVKGQKQWFEPELYMSGRRLPGSEVVVLRPTIWISCGSTQCQKVLQNAVKDLSYTGHFPVHVTRHAPRLAGLETTATESSRLDEVYEEEINYVMSDAIWTNHGHADRSDNQVEIWVQSPFSNNNSACGLKVQIRDACGVEHMCRLGGLVCIGDKILGLATAHAIPKISSNVSSHGSEAGDEALFVFKPHRMHDDIHIATPLHNTVSPTDWLPATVYLARYGAIPGLDLRGSSRSLVTPEEAMYDFALLQVDFGSQKRTQNRYESRSGTQVLQGVSNVLTARAVSLVCSYNDIRSGWLLEGERIIVGDTACWKTRKIQLQAPLGKTAQTLPFVTPPS